MIVKTDIAWLPMESAPTDGQVVLVYVERARGEYASFGYFEDGEWWSPDTDYLAPRGWMPCPSTKNLTTTEVTE